MLIRAVGCSVTLPFLPFIARELSLIEPHPARLVVDFHSLFNLLLAVVFIFPVDRIAKLLIRLLPDPVLPSDPAVPRYLDQGALDTASVALANAAREALRMADMIEAMLSGSLEVFRSDDRKRAAEISRMDGTLDQLSVAVRHYLADLAGEPMNKEDSIRSQEIFSFAINIEHIGDIIANNLLEFAAKKTQRGQSFSEHELKEIRAMHAQVLESLKLGLVVFLRGDERAARQLVAKKALLWHMENEATDCYFQTLREAVTRKGDAGDVYLRVSRDLKRIHSHIAALAYPILDRAGLLQNRLIESAPIGPAQTDESEPTHPLQVKS